MSKSWAALNLLGLIFSVLGGVLLFFSLTLKPSNYSLVETANHKVAICLGEKLVTSGFWGDLVLSDDSCPQGIGPNRAAVIEAYKPECVPWGLGLIWVG